MNNVFPFHLIGGAWKVGLDAKPQEVEGNINWIYILIRKIDGAILPTTKVSNQGSDSAAAAGRGSEGREFSNLIEQSRFAHSTSPRNYGPFSYLVLS